MKESEFIEFCKRLDAAKAPLSPWAQEIGYGVQKKWEDNTSEDLGWMIARAIDMAFLAGRDSGILHSKSIPMGDAR